jgi:hypothetical protein
LLIELLTIFQRLQAQLCLEIFLERSAFDEFKDHSDSTIETSKVRRA